MPFTLSDVRTLLLEFKESDEPDKVLGVFEAEKGKAFSKRLLAKLPGGPERWRIRSIANMTYITTRAPREPGSEYERGDSGKAFDLLVAYAVSNITIDPEFLVEKNTAYFAARKARNELRSKAVADPMLCTTFAEAMTSYEAAKNELKRAEAQLNVFTAYGETFSPDKYEWERLCGAREPEPKK